VRAFRIVAAVAGVAALLLDWAAKSLADLDDALTDYCVEIPDVVPVEWVEDL
jgi:hypothetical protein